MPASPARRRSRPLAPAAALLLAVAGPLAAGRSGAVQINLETLSCAGYHGALLDPAQDVPHPDGIDFVMWLLGYSIGAAGEHVMYADALASFGFALDAQCRQRPGDSLLQAIRRVQPQRTTPMDLARLDCRDFETRHAQVRRTDPESAATIMSALQGYAAAKAGSTVIDTATREAFSNALGEECARHPQASLEEAVAAVAAPLRPRAGRDR